MLLPSATLRNNVVFLDDVASIGLAARVTTVVLLLVGAIQVIKMESIQLLVDHFSRVLILYWGLATFASTVALLPVPFAQSFR